MAEIGLPKRWHTREDSGLVLDRELNWVHDGERITHPRIIEAFNAGLVPTDDGRDRDERRRPAEGSCGRSKNYFLCPEAHAGL